MRSVLRWCEWAVMAISALGVLLFLLVALRRLRYPFELDRMESAMMTTVWRVVHGMPVYVRPSLEWAPFLYSPLFFYASAAMTHLVGVGYQALRLISIVATLGSGAVLGALVYRETRNRTAAVAAVGLFAMLYGLVLSWYDIGRVDSLSLFFFLLAVYCMRFRSPVLAAVVWVLAFQTKQSFLPVAVLAFAVDWQRPRRLLLGLGSFAVLAVASVGYANHVTQGWYSYYVFGSVPQLGLSLFDAKNYIPFDLLKPLPIVLAFLALTFVLQPPHWRGQRTIFYGWLTILILGGIWFARAHVGSYFNTLMPAYAWMCLLFGLALARLLRLTTQSPSSTTLPAWPALLLLMAFAQIAMHLYRPGEFSATTQTAAVHWEFIHRLQATPGDVWLTNHSYDGLLAGKPMHAEMDAFDSVLGRGDAASIAEVQQAIATHHFTAILLDRPADTYSPKWLFSSPEFNRQYPLHALAPAAPVAASGDQPVMMYLACQPRPGVEAALNVGATYVQQGLCPSSGVR